MEELAKPSQETFSDHFLQAVFPISLYPWYLKIHLSPQLFGSPSSTFKQDSMQFYILPFTACFYKIREVHHLPPKPQLTNLSYLSIFSFLKHQKMEKMKNLKKK